MERAPSEGSDQIRVFAIRMKKAWVLSYHSKFKFIHFSGYTITYNYMRCNTISNILVANHWTHSEDSDQTERMRRLIWVLAGRTVILLVLLWGGSNIDAQELLLQHMFLGCNCNDKHVVETKNNLLQFLEHLLYSFFFVCHKNYSIRIWTESVTWHHQE